MEKVCFNKFLTIFFLRKIHYKGTKRPLRCSSEYHFNHRTKTESFKREFLVRLAGNAGHNITKHIGCLHYLAGSDHYCDWRPAMWTRPTCLTQQFQAFPCFLSNSNPVNHNAHYGFCSEATRAMQYCAVHVTSYSFHYSQILKLSFRSFTNVRFCDIHEFFNAMMMMTYFINN